jgi:hypothetical protein
MQSQFHKYPIFLVLMLSLIFISACSGIQIGFEPEQPVQDIPAEQVQPAHPISDLQGPAGEIVQETVSEPVQQEPSTEQFSQESAPIQVNGWLGYIVSNATYGDHVVLMPEGTGEFGITGATAEIENEIIGLRDKPEPGKHAHLWGQLNCDVEDHQGCQLIIERLRYGANNTHGDMVDGWQGTIKSSTFNGGQSFIFELAGPYAIWYSIHSNDEGILQKLTNLADSGTSVLVWGELLTGIPDVNGLRIQAAQIDVVQ